MTTIKRISTDSIELALEQLMRVKVSGVRASIRPDFVIDAFKELLDKRKEERLLLNEVDAIINDGSSLDLIVTNSSRAKLKVDEVTDLDELGNSRWSYPTKIIEQREPATTSDHTPACSDNTDSAHGESTADCVYDNDHQTHKKIDHDQLRIRSSKKLSSHQRWSDGRTAQRVVIFTLLTITLLTLSAVLA